MKMTNQKKFLQNKKGLCLLGVVLLLLVVALVLGPRLLYGNPLFQVWVQNQISEQTKGLFKFEKISGSFFSADLREVQLDLEQTDYNVRQVESPRMAAAFSLWPLLQNKLAIRSLMMEGGSLDLKLSGGEADQIALPVAPHFQMKKGSVRLSHLSGWTLQMNECNLKAKQSGDGASMVIEGQISASSARLGALELKALSGTFSLEGGHLKVEHFQALLPGNSKLKLSGSYALAGKRSLQMKAHLQTADVQNLLKGLDFSEKFAGQADVTWEAEGLFTPSQKSLQGSGKAVLKKISANVVLPKFPAFNNAPIFDRIRNLGDLHGTALFKLNQSDIVIGELKIRNKEIQINGSARVGYDRSLSSDFMFIGSKQVDEEIPSIARDAFQHDAEGQVLIPFALVGSTREPKVDVGDVVGKILSNPVKILNPLNLFN
jgi:hypothetical protein